MRLILDIHVDGTINAGEGDTAEILRRFADLLDVRPTGRRAIEFVSPDGSFPNGAIRDVNGDKVGNWEVYDRDEPIRLDPLDR